MLDASPKIDRANASPGNKASPALTGFAEGADQARRIAELEAEIAALRSQAEQSQVILDSAIDYAIITMDTDGFVTSWNAGAQRIMGYSEAEILGRSTEIVFTSEDRAASRFATELRRATEAGSATNERWHLRRDGTRFWASGTMMPLLDAEGQLRGFLNILRDQTEARAEAERRELLMAEMNHRIKNSFAIVQAVASQTQRHAADPADFQAAFRARLAVLARSHDVLIRADWHDAPLRDVIGSALEAFNGASRITVEGPPVLLAANLAVTVSLAFHELATNALKYGALSAPDGRVEVAWTVVPHRKGASRADIIWRESGGPAVQPPQRRGFGSQLLEKGLPSDGTVRIDFRPEGLECRLGLPLGGASGRE